MPRLNTSDELFRRLTKIQVVRHSGVSATAGASWTAGASTITATNTFGTAVAALIISGPTGVELNESTATTTALIPTLWPINAAQDTASGTVTIYKAASTNLGHITQEGVQISPAYSQTPVFSAIQDLPLVYIGGQAEISMSFNLYGFNVLNWQTAFGIPESETGSGTATAPYQGWLGGSQFGSQTLQCFRFTGTRIDGKIVFVELNDAKIEVTGQVSMNSQTPASIACNAKGTSMTVRYGTSLVATA